MTSKTVSAIAVTIRRAFQRSNRDCECSFLMNEITLWLDDIPTDPVNTEVLTYLTVVLHVLRVRLSVEVQRRLCIIPVPFDDPHPLHWSLVDTQTAKLLKMVYQFLVVLSVAGSAWYLVLKLRCRERVDSVLELGLLAPPRRIGKDYKTKLWIGIYSLRYCPASRPWIQRFPRSISAKPPNFWTNFYFINRFNSHLR